MHLVAAWTVIEVIKLWYCSQTSCIPETHGNLMVGGYDKPFAPIKVKYPSVRILALRCDVPYHGHLTNFHI